MRLCHLVFGFALPALALAALPDPPESCLEDSDVANLLQSKKGGTGKPSSVNRSAELLLNRPTGADDDIADRPTELEFFSLGTLAARKLLPIKNITKVALLQILDKVLHKTPGDYGSASIYAPLITAGAIGVLLILCAIAATVKQIRNPSLEQNPMSVNELQEKRQHLMALIKANVPRKPWAPPEPISEAPGNTRSLAQDRRDSTGQMCDQMHSQRRGQDHHRMQGQIHGQSLSTHQEPMQIQQERRRDVIVNHPLEGDRLGINLTSDDLLITGILDPRAQNFGFSVGEHVTHINGVRVESRADFVDALKAAIRNNKLAGYPVVVQVVSQAPVATEPASLPVYAAPHRADSDIVDAAFRQPQTLHHAGEVPQRYNAIFQEPTPALPQNKFQTTIPVFQQQASAFQQIPIYEAAPQASVSACAPAGLSSAPLAVPAWSESPTLPRDLPDNSHDDTSSKAELKRRYQEAQATMARPDQKLGDVERKTMQLFERLDKNNDGEVNKAEFERGLQEIQAAMGRSV